MYFLSSLQVPHPDEAADGVVVALLELEPDVAGDDLGVGALGGRAARAGRGGRRRPRAVDRPAKEVDGAPILRARVQSFGLQGEGEGVISVCIKRDVSFPLNIYIFYDLCTKV